MRMDQRKGLTKVTRLAPVAITGKVQSFIEVALPATTRSFYKGLDKGEVIDAHPEHRAVIKGRGGADVITGSDRAGPARRGQGLRHRLRQGRQRQVPADRAPRLLLTRAGPLPRRAP